VPYNLVTTNDIIGGNSGSPVIDKERRIVGLIFDGNIQSLGGDYGFDASVNRAVAVDARAILHTAKVIYRAERLVNELLGTL
ncbi:MAG: S46 family peptidase, partial [Myxococcales bacterium]|nr:S46 family peptidase [Myxococcales bacterium]